MKKTILVVLVLLLAAAGVYFYGGRTASVVPLAVTGTATYGETAGEVRTLPRTRMSLAQAASVHYVTLAPGIESVLSIQTGVLKAIAEDPTILAETRAANDKDKSLSLDAITQLDIAWINSKNGTPFSKQFLSNTTAKRLLALQKDHPGFTKIFVVDRYGLNVGQTTNTSDYFQADEPWWVSSFNDGAGATFHGNIEFDQSSETDAISIYTPIMDPTSGTAIGVIKGVFPLSALAGKL